MNVTEVFDFANMADMTTGPTTDFTTDFMTGFTTDLTTTPPPSDFRSWFVDVIVKVPLFITISRKTCVI